MKKKSGSTEKTLAQITEKDGFIWTQTFDAAGEITSSFISDSVDEALWTILYGKKWTYIPDAK